MKWYLKRYPDGHEYTPCRDGAPPREGWEIVDKIPDDIRDKEPGGKDWKEPRDPRDEKIEALEARLAALEKRK